MNKTEMGLPEDCAFDSHDEYRAAYGAWIATVEEFEQLRGEWTQLFNAVGPAGSLLSFDSIFDRWNLSEPGSKLAIIAVRHAGGRLVGLAPFHIARSEAADAGARRLSFLVETQSAADRSRILIDPEFEDAVAQEIARMLVHHRHEWDYVDLALPGLMPLLDYVNSMARTRATPAIARLP